MGISGRGGMGGFLFLGGRGVVFGLFFTTIIIGRRRRGEFFFDVFLLLFLVKRRRVVRNVLLTVRGFFFHRERVRGKMV